MRAQAAELIAEGAKPDLLEPPAQRLQTRGEAADRMLAAEAWLAAGAGERAEALLTQLAQGGDAAGARAAAILAQRLLDRGAFAAARPLAGHAARLAPANAAVEAVLGQLCDFDGRADAALEHYGRAVALRPRDTALLGRLSVVQLVRGDLRRGFSTWALADEINQSYGEGCPVWDGQPLGDARLLILCGYGYGDIIQMLRFALQVREREPRARLLVVVPPPLLRLAAAMDCFEAVYTAMPDVAQFEWQVTQTRLPVALRVELSDAQRHRPFLRVAPADVEAARAWLPPRRPGVKRVGLRWQGQPRHFDAKRGLAVATLGPLLQVPGIEWVALVEDPALVAPGMIDVSAHLSDFYATAALLHQLDLVISVDTSVLHLAGALDLPAWLLARPDPEWRWGTGGESTPWYASVRVLRHAPRTFDQAAQVARAARDLRAWVAT
ncbi:MAG TPA: hypothetical protein VGN52_18400 [Burkholderiales bacterium]